MPAVPYTAVSNETSCKEKKISVCPHKEAIVIMFSQIQRLEGA